ncbi:hypothetical protein [Chryseobacterium phocaeense]|uniref:hypothetical protein n=1 Tax=Chryseobacterium phocaeense TaxID=1816690 RepID=UPI0009BBEC37|nr:hypothetical protein [Chryseobacterium phocaeense]
MKKSFIISIIFVLVFNNYKPQQANLALGKTVTSSSVDDSSFPNSNLTDGNFTTVARTGSSQVPPNAEWFMVDLGADYFIQNIKLGSVVPDNTKSRRFMIITFASNYPNMGYIPTDYINSSASISLYNRFIYTANSDSDQFFGRPTPSSAVPSTAGQNLGPVFNNGIYSLNIGIHRARYILILNLQDSNLEFTELEVTSGVIPVRTFINGNFEQGTTSSTWEPVPEGIVPGWSTTDAIAGISPNANRLADGKGGSIDFISLGYMNVPAYQGTYYAELNSFINSKLEQTPICILPNETFNWSFAHRGRNGTDVMRLVIDEIDVAEFKDNNAQSGTHTGVLINPGGAASNVTVNKDPTATTGWTRYHGRWKNNSGVSKMITFGFRAVSSASGSNISAGNFVDDVKISGLSAIMTFDRLNPTGNENVPTANLPKLLINGTLAVPRTVQITLGGTATRGSDYTTTPATGPFSITVPAGNYDGTPTTAISLASIIQVEQDLFAEGSETLTFTLVDPGTGDLQPADASTCQGAVVTSTYKITDNVCYKNAVNTGTVLSTNVGITAFNRAGINNGNWPMLRNGGYLALESSTKGLVLSRTTKSSITDPVVGMIIYELNDNCLSIYTSTGWRCYQNFSCPD